MARKQVTTSTVAEAAKEEKSAAETRKATLAVDTTGLPLVQPDRLYAKLGIRK